MAAPADAPVTRWASSTGIYGVVSVAVVVVAWESDGDRWDLTGLIFGYMLVLLLTHSYAYVVGSGLEGSWRTALRHELPVAGAGVPALIVALLGALGRWDDETTANLALIACAITLLAMQVAILRPHGASRRRIVTTAVYDLVAGALVVFLHVLID